MLLELMELGYDTASTTFSTQLKKKDRPPPPRLGSRVHADTIMDRIVHEAD